MKRTAGRLPRLSLGEAARRWIPSSSACVHWKDHRGGINSSDGSRYEDRPVLLPRTDLGSRSLGASWRVGTVPLALCGEVHGSQNKAQPDRTAPRWFGQSTAEGPCWDGRTPSMLAQACAAEDRYERWSDKRLAESSLREVPAGILSCPPNERMEIAARQELSSDSELVSIIDKNARAPICHRPSACSCSTTIASRPLSVLPPRRSAISRRRCSPNAPFARLEMLTAELT